MGSYPFGLFLVSLDSTYRQNISLKAFNHFGRFPREPPSPLTLSKKIQPPPQLRTENFLADAAVTVKNYSKFQPPSPRYNYKYSIFECFHHSGSVFSAPLIQFLTNMFSTITIPFFVRKFLETKRSFEKNHQKVHVAAADEDIGLHLYVEMQHCFLMRIHQSCAN